ncbi:MAG: ATP-binding protein, partial [Verrucomicrobia bacterium]|nr:ATP-binding protein [Verrucomicrobiota bacterium]
PGDKLRELLNAYGPCLILIDEWVAYARQLHDEKNLPGGDFGTQFTFAQTLTESTKLAKGCLLVISLPASEATGFRDVLPDDVEVGGRRGREALDCLRNVIGRIESPWRTASAEESFEIVRKRLFEPLAGEGYKDRDVIARSFSDFYRKQAQEFPPECSEERYEQRIKAAYPFHPELFERLYTDWSSNPQFQRTRGILRLMAAVIHHLWEQGDKNPLIMPGNIPIDYVQSELTRYLPDPWMPILESDVDGPRSLPWRLDRELSGSLGKHQICRRVARTIWMGSAPVSKAANCGIEDRRIKLGCALPGEQLAQFGDALRRLSDLATYLYSDGPRYWYTTQPTVSKLAEERAEQFRRDRDKIMHELEQRLRSDLKNSGDFNRIHPVPTSSADVPDDVDARLVVLSADHSYSRDSKSAAEKEAIRILETTGTSPRHYLNALVFLAPDKTRLQELETAISRFLAWKSIVNEENHLNLTENQKNQARTQNNAADLSVKAKITEVYQWLLIPHQVSPKNSIEWKAIRLNGGQEGLAERASKRLKNDELLLTTYAPTRLRLDLNNMSFLWRDKDYIAIRKLINDFSSYPYLPRLKNADVLIQAVQNGFGLTSWVQDSFAYADSFDELSGRFLGLRPGNQVIFVTSTDSGLLVRPDAAIRQIESETPNPSVDTSKPVINPEKPSLRPLVTTAPNPKRYYGSVMLDATRVGRDASKIADEVITYLAGLLGSSVRIKIEIEADIPTGVPAHIVKIVTEKSQELKFQNHGFELE